MLKLTPTLRLAVAIGWLAGCGGDSSPETVTTAKGVLTVPGSAFADGRDPEASPPQTVTAINVWDSAARRRRVCQVAHTDPLELLSVERSETEGRYYFEVRSRACTGWLPESFVSPDAP
jgi:hypothetical protein